MESFKGVVSSEYYRKVCLQYLKKKKSQKMHKIEPSLCFLLSFGFFSAYSFSYVLFNLVDKTKRYRLDNFFFQEFFFKISTEIFPGVLASQNLNASAIIDQKLIPGETVVLSAGPPVASLHVEMRWSVIKGGMLVGFLDLHMECRLYCLLL